VIGTSGSGKTTFGQHLAAVSGAPFIELDAIHWGPDWTPLDKEPFRQRVADQVAGQLWVIDGNYSAVRDLVWGRATAIIWLNYSLPRTFWRVFSRTMRRVFTREKLYSGNVETIKLLFFDRESLLWWVLTTHGNRRQRFGAMLGGGVYQGIPVIEFNRPRQAEVFLERYRQSVGGKRLFFEYTASLAVDNHM
jgi:adenylate kinase family enzyme